MLIALAFAHFPSELLLKEQMIIPVKKTLNNAGHIDAKLINLGRFFREFAPENPAKICFFFREISEALLLLVILFLASVACNTEAAILEYITREARYLCE